MKRNNTFAQNSYDFASLSARETISLFHSSLFSYTHPCDDNCPVFRRSGFDSCQGLRFFSLFHVDQFTFHSC